MVTVVRCPRCGQPAQLAAEREAVASLRCPHCEAIFPRSEATPNDDAETEGMASFVAAPSEPEAPAEPALPARLDLVVRCPHCLAEAALEELTVASTGEPLDATVLADALKHASHAEEETLQEGPLLLGPQVAAPPTPATAAWTRQAESPKRFLGQLLGILLGGLLAIPIAYYLLNAIGGAAFDLVPVPLPGVTHTYKHLPPWWPHWARPQHAPDEGEEPR